MKKLLLIIVITLLFAACDRDPQPMQITIENLKKINGVIDMEKYQKRMQCLYTNDQCIIDLFMMYDKAFERIGYNYQATFLELRKNNYYNLKIASSVFGDSISMFSLPIGLIGKGKEEVVLSSGVFNRKTVELIKNDLKHKITEL